MALHRETIYQNKLVKKLQDILPGCFILQNDPEEYQGIPDLLLLFGNRWAALEVKMSPTSRIQPNQQYYVNLFDEMAFASFICPETEEQVIKELVGSFGC